MSGPVIAAQAELPIPCDVQPGRGWSAVMLDMAAHIGPYDVLRLCESYGGQQVYFPVDMANAPFGDILGEEKAARLCRAYQRERVTLPTARYAIAVARRGGVIAAVRAGAMTVAQAAAVLRLRRDTVSSLVKSGEGQDCAPSFRPIGQHDTRQLDMFGDADQPAHP